MTVGFFELSTTPIKATASDWVYNAPLAKLKSSQEGRQRGSSKYSPGWGPKDDEIHSPWAGCSQSVGTPSKWEFLMVLPNLPWTPRMLLYHPFPPLQCRGPLQPPPSLLPCHPHRHFPNNILACSTPPRHLIFRRSHLHDE